MPPFPSQRPGSPPEDEATTASLSVLVVDDNELLLRSIRRYLTHVGIRVFGCNDAGRALRVFGERNSDIDVVVLDLRMPDYSGDDVFQKMRKIRPDIPVVAMTGALGIPTEQAQQLRGVADLLFKPFEMRELVDALHSAVDLRTLGEEELAEDPPEDTLG